MNSTLQKIIFVLAVTTALFISSAAFAPNTSIRAPGARSNLDTRRYNFFENIGSFISNFGREVTASHILIGPGTMNQEDAQAKLIEIKEEVNDDPEKFAEMATEWSTCRGSKTNGGDLGTFGPGLMVKPVDKCCFEEEVGVVHGPISSMYGEHLILIRDRTEKK